MEALSKLNSWIYGKRERKLILLGPPGSGKTTLLYQWKLGTAVETIPTIGFNIEYVKHKGWTFDVRDMAGWERIQRHALYHMTAETIVLFIHDCTADEQGTDESVKLLHDHAQALVNDSGKTFWILFNKQDLLPSEEQPKVIDHLRQRFTSELARHSEFEWKISAQPGLSTKTGERVRAILDDVVIALNSEPRKPLSPPKTLALPQALDEVRGSSEDDLPTDSELNEKIKAHFSTVDLEEGVFWGKFLSGELEHWDHNVFLRAAYKTLLEALTGGRGIWEATDEFLVHAQLLMWSGMSSDSNANNRTMVTFWMYHLSFAIESYKARMHLSRPSKFSDLERVLLQYPALIHERLWNLYYSEELMFSNGSREYWRLPDLQALPSPNITRLSWALERPTAESADNPETLIRFGFAVVKKYLNGEAVRRGEILKHALSALQSTTQRQRASNKSIPPYSETQAYFWIQLVHSALASLDSVYFDKSNKHPIAAKELPYSGFQMLFHMEPTAWRQYYTEKRWNGIEARIAFVPPDIVPLTNVIRAESTGLSHRYLSSEWENRLVNTPDLPSDEELAFYCSLMLDSIPKSETHGIKGHAQLLQSLYQAFVDSERSTSRSGETFEQHFYRSVDRLNVKGFGSRTRVKFWAIMVFKAASAVKQHDSSSSQSSFENLTRSNRYLAYEDLPLCYYSEELWNSEKASLKFVKPDRRLDFTQDEQELQPEDVEEKKDWVVV